MLARSFKDNPRTPSIIPHPWGWTPSIIPHHPWGWTPSIIPHPWGCL